MLRAVKAIFSIVVLSFILSGCGDRFSFDDIERLPKPIVYLRQNTNNILCSSHHVIDGNRTTWFEQGCEASSTGLRKVGTLTNE